MTLGGQNVPSAMNTGCLPKDGKDCNLKNAADKKSEQEDDFDSVCEICDNGGELLCCDGICMRSFHATREAGRDSLCKSLGFTSEKVQAMQIFVCKNCEQKQHQCFVCGELGASDKSLGAKVFQCSNATCGYFYHPQCAAKWLHGEDEVAVEELQQKIASGGTFTCSIHKCCICHRGENKRQIELQFAICRRCPTSYHRKCLPRDIYFAEKDDEEEKEGKEEEEDVVYRAWDNLLPNRILIYCLKHDICEELGTPMRDHIKFPEVEENRENRASAKKSKSLVVKKSLDSECEEVDANAVKVIKDGETISDFLKKVRADDLSRRYSREKTSALRTTKSEKATLGKRKLADSELDKTKKAEIDLLDTDSKRRVLTLMEEVDTLVTLEDVMKKYLISSASAYSSNNNVDKTITLGKIEGAVEAVRRALKMIKDGCKIEEAESICPPEVLKCLYKWQNNLKTYLAPVLDEKCNASCGRPFTKVEKLERSDLNGCDASALADDKNSNHGKAVDENQQLSTSKDKVRFRADGAPSKPLQTGYQVDSMSFAPGPCDPSLNPYKSAGWLDE